MVAIFVNLRAAFDSVDREELVKGMRKLRVRKGLVERVEEILRETRSKVRVRSMVGREFWTARGMRQRCPLSPLLVNLLLADIEEKMRKVQ